MSQQAKATRKTSAAIYGAVLMNIGAVSAGVVVGLVASYQIKKMATKATGQAGDPSLLVKLAPTIVSAVATYGAVKAEDEHLQMFCIGAAATAGAVSLFSLAGNDATTKYVGVTLGVLPDTDTLPTHQAGMEYDAAEEEIEDVDYEMNLPSELSAPEASEPFQGLAVLPRTTTSEDEPTTYISIV